MSNRVWTNTALRNLYDKIPNENGDADQHIVDVLASLAMGPEYALDNPMPSMVNPNSAFGGAYFMAVLCHDLVDWWTDGMPA